MTGFLPDTARDVAGDDRQPRPELAELVRAMLGRRVRDLGIEVDGRGLVLRGRADSYHAKQLAQHVAMAALGLPLSANKIVVTDRRREAPGPGGGAAADPGA